MTRDCLLLMRKGYGIHGDHIAAMNALGWRIHLVTERAEATQDPRFASVEILESGMGTEEAALRTTRLASERGGAPVITFQETDVVVAGLANAELGRKDARPHADRIARDKGLQRNFLREAGLPSVWYAEVSTSRDEVLSEVDRRDHWW